jgi:hypothetical protein
MSALRKWPALEAEYGKHGERLQVYAVENVLLVADARAFEMDRLKLLYLDYKRNIVRHSTVEIDYAWDTWDHRWAWKFRETCYWMLKHNPLTGEGYEDGAELADDYRASGRLGRLIYGLELN